MQIFAVELLTSCDCSHVLRLPLSRNAPVHDLATSLLRCRCASLLRLCDFQGISSADNALSSPCPLQVMLILSRSPVSSMDWVQPLRIHVSVASVPWVSLFIHHNLLGRCLSQDLGIGFCHGASPC